MTDTDAIRPLAALRPNEEALIVEVAHARGCGRRLCELGLCPGMVVRMLAPGRTCLLRAGGASLSIRAEELDAILVERLLPAAS
ncbi:MAG: FeoA family protein [Candidatus Sumerlaeia bacterium]|nr:FeoA family protein [Candidatus Sumerlaeia bacterium]